MGKTVVVGGGTSGLAAAFTLEKAGADCLVLEKRDFSGGRIYGTVREGFLLDLGAQFFFSRYRTTFELMRGLAIADQLVKFVKPMGILRDGNVHVLYPDIKENLRHPTAGLKFGALSNRGKLMGVKLALKLAMLGKKLDFDDPLKAIELDDISFSDYARRNFGDELLEYLIQPIASTLTLGEPEEISAAYGLALAWYFAPGLWTTRKGIGLLADSLSKNVSNLKLNTAVSRIVLEDKKVKGVEVKAGRKTDFIEADNVVCGTLAGEAAGLLPDLPKTITDTLAGIKYSACTHVMFALPRKLMGDIYAIATPRREGLCFSGLTENAVKAPAYAPADQGIVHAYTFGNYGREMLGMSDKEVRERVTRDIRAVVPRFPDEPIFCEIFRWPEAVCLSSPGQITAVRRMKVALRPYEGLHLTGEYFGMPSVEGALHSGVQAAERIIMS